MTPVETRPTPTPTPDPRLLEQVMACDAFLHSSSVRDRIDATPPLSTEADDRGRSRLRLLLTMLDAADATADAPGEKMPIACGKLRSRNGCCWADSK